MPDGDSHIAFAEAAARDGIVLATHEVFSWLTELGHITLEELADEPPAAANSEALIAAAEALDRMYIELGGDIDVLVACRRNMHLMVELTHAATGTLIEIDEPRHFTPFRLTTLDLYPPDAKLGFDLETYRELCRDGAADNYRLSRLAAKGFGFGGIPRERAYRDALRDLATPAVGRPPLVRFVALDGDGAAAYEANKESLVSRLGAAR